MLKKTKKVIRQKKHNVKSRAYKYIHIQEPTSTCPKSNQLCINPHVLIKPMGDKEIKGHYDGEKGENVQEDIIQRFKQRDLNIRKNKLDPRRDYYTFINHEWIQRETVEFNKKSNYFIKFDSFRILQNKINYEIIDIVKDYVKNNHTQHARNVRNIYESALKSDHGVMMDNIKELKVVLENFFNEGNVTKFLAYLNRNEMVSWGCPLSWSMSSDEKDAANLRHHIFAPELSYFDYDLYIVPGSESNKYSAQYKKEFNEKFVDYINTLFYECLGPNHGLNPADVLTVELDMLNAMNCFYPGDSMNFYNIVKPKDYNKYGIDLSEFAKHLGCEHRPEFFIIGSTSYVSCIMDKLNKEWTSPKWKAYWYYMILRQMSIFSKKLHPLRHTFFKKIVAGFEGIIPQEIFPLFSLSYCFNTFLSRKYIDKNYYPSRVYYVRNLGENLRKTFIKIIQNNKWLNPKTKESALKKLEHLIIDAVNPRFMVEDAEIDFPENNIWSSMTIMSHWRTDFLLKLDGKHYVELPGIDFGVNNGISLSGTQPYIVNAFYDATKNNIYIPMGIIQEPFIKLDAGLEYNIAHIGYTFGHELSHCLDNTGRLFDYKGNMNNWWTKEDEKKFNKKVKDVVKQYETFASYDGIKMDAAHMSGENLADISGMAICLDYLHTAIHQGEMNTAIGYLSFRKFFTYIAFQWREIVYEKAVEWNIKSNPHPMVKYRTNCPLARMDVFKLMYNVLPGDKMYWKSDTIWSN